MNSLTQKAINADDLIEALRRREYQTEELDPIEDLAEVRLVNSSPAVWGAVVVAGGVKFFCRDGSQYLDGPRQLSLPAGATTLFRHNRPRACVYQFVIALEIRVGDEAPATLTFQDGVAAGKCLLSQTLTLERQGILSETAVASGRRSDRLGLTATV